MPAPIRNAIRRHTPPVQVASLPAYMAAHPAYTQLWIGHHQLICYLPPPQLPVDERPPRFRGPELRFLPAGTPPFRLQEDEPIGYVLLLPEAWYAAIHPVMAWPLNLFQGISNLPLNSKEDQHYLQELLGDRSHRRERQDWPALVATLVVDLVIPAWQQVHAPGSAMLRQFAALVGPHLAQHWTIEVYADQLHVSASSLKQALQREWHTSFSRYVDRCFRQRMVQAMVLAPERKLSVLAAELGLSSKSHLSTWFKKHLGITPREFKALMRG